MSTKKLLWGVVFLIDIVFMGYALYYTFTKISIQSVLLTIITIGMLVSSVFKYLKEREKGNV
ncbi:hypothetical protein [Amedibacillus sp. YH-ame10]